MSRLIPLQGIENFRDFGGYETRCGRGVKRGLLYRSGHHARASDADLEAMRALGIAVIVDLRRPNERERDPSRRWPGFSGTVIESDAAQESLVEWLEFLNDTDLSIAAFRQYMLDYYRAAPSDPRYVDLYRRYFQALAATDGAMLVHCAAGKDRTGMICALTHHMAGVGEEDIVADFLATNDPARIAARMEVVAALIHEHTGRMPSEEAVEYAVGVQAEHLHEAFAAMRASHGSIDGYLEGALGVDEQVRQRIHDRVLG